MTITPVAPVNREKLVPTSTSIIIDFTGTPTLVDVNSTVVFDGSFQGGWMGSLINKPGGGKRLVLDPPSDFALGQLVTVDVTENGTENLVYIFETGTTQITTTDDASSPRVVETGTSPSIEPYIAYVRRPGETYLRRDNPLTPEIKVVDGEIVDIGWDPTLQKLIVFFVNNGKVFVTTADPGDGPTSLTQPSALVDRYLAKTGSSGKSSDFSSQDFPPLKIVGLDNYVIGVGSSGRSSSFSGFPDTITPTVISLSPRIVRFSRPAEPASSTFAVGFIPLKFTKGAMRRLPFVPLPEGAAFVDYEDPAENPGARYAALVVYTRGQSAGLIEGPRGGAGSLPLAADVSSLKSGSSGRSVNFTSEDFPPLKLAVPLDQYEVKVGSAGRSFSFTSTGFPPVGVG